MISKEKFCNIISQLKETNDFVDEVNRKAKELHNNIANDFFDAMSLSISHEELVVQLLEEIFDDSDMISWWIYELDYGRKYKKGCIQDADGKNINVSTVEKLYDYLVANMDK